MPYYAIESTLGKKIFKTWEECQAFRDKAPNSARYHKFSSLEEANSFLNMTADRPETHKVANGKDCLEAYVDGSYNAETEEWGYGAVLLKNNKILGRFTGSGTKYAESRNITGEVYGAIKAVEEAIALGYGKMTLYYDYAGIEAWATGAWQTTKLLTMEYREAMMNLMRHIDITFVKVAAHTGVHYNEMADKLAKGAVGL